MKISHLLLLLILVLLLGAGIFLKSQKTENVETRDLFIPMTVKVNPEDVFEINITKGGDELFLKKISDKGWFLETLWNAPVEEKKVTALLKLLQYVQGELRTTDEALFSDFGISDDQAYSLELKSVTGKTLLHLMIGTKQPDELSVFVRRGGEPKVYLSDMPLLRALNIYSDKPRNSLDQEFWLDLELTQRDFSTAKKFTLENLEKVNSEIRFEKNANEKWEIQDPLFAFDTDSEKVENLLKRMSEWTGLQVVDPKENYGFREKGFDIEVVFEGRDRERFFIVPVGTGEAKKFYVKKEGDFRVMEISEFHVKNFDTEKKKFIKMNPFQIEPEKIKEVLLRHKVSEMFLGATKEQMDSLTKIANVFKDFEMKVMRVETTEELKDFEESVPYEAVIRESPEGPSWNFGIGEEDPTTGRHILKVKDDDRFYSISKSIFQSIFFPFETQAVQPELERNETEPEVALDEAIS